MVKLEHQQTSDGEELSSPSPRLSSSLSPGSSTCRSPSPPGLVFASCAPPKKRFKLNPVEHVDPVDNGKKSPFRPWMDKAEEDKTSPTLDLLGQAHQQGSFPFNPYLLWHSALTSALGSSMVNAEPEQQEPLALVTTKKDEEQLSKPTANSDTNLKKDDKKSKQRNYKNMTRERRIEANARERQRVQTITEQFETLRHVIPIDDKGAKMSKLSIIKIATSYIMYLSRQCGYDYTQDKSAPTIEECYHNLTNLIKYEAKINNAAAGGETKKD